MFRSSLRNDFFFSLTQLYTNKRSRNRAKLKGLIQFIVYNSVKHLVISAFARGRGDKKEREEGVDPDRRRRLSIPRRGGWSTKEFSASRELHDLTFAREPQLEFCAANRRYRVSGGGLYLRLILYMAVRESLAYAVPRYTCGFWKCF